MRRVAQHRGEHLGGERDQIGVGHPRAVEPVGGFALLVLAHAGERPGVHVGVAAAGNERRHATDGVGAAPVAGADQEVGVGPHERHRHGDLGAVGQHPLGALPEFLDDAEDVIPAPGVEPGAVLAQLVEDLLHFERREDRLDQDRRADRAAGQAEGVLGEAEDVVPQPRLEVRLELRQVEVRPRTPLQQRAGVVEEVQAEVEQARRNRLAREMHVALGQVPAAGPDHQGRRPLPDLVHTAVGARVVQRVARGVLEIRLTLHDVIPGR